MFAYCIKMATRKAYFQRGCARRGSRRRATRRHKELKYIGLVGGNCGRQHMGGRKKRYHGGNWSSMWASLNDSSASYVDGNPRSQPFLQNRSGSSATF